MRTTGIIAIIFVSWLLWLTVSQYLFCARYSFPDPEPFEGAFIYNPYDSLQPENWHKANFHAHAHAWNGVTNGHGTAQDVHAAYDSMQYAVHCVSNYHFVDTTNIGKSNYLPAYEHGYNTLKTHQLVLGSSRVQWLDYLLPQTVHNKQHILQELQEWGAVTILNHPAVRNGYSVEDLAQLGNYDCMEVLNPAAISEKQWDAALSAGRRVSIVGNDDTHDVIHKNRLGRMCTYLNIPDLAGTSTLEALRDGRSYGVVVGAGQALDSMPRLLRVRVAGDSVFAEMDQPAVEAVVRGQGGKKMAGILKGTELRFRLTPEDHYARTVFYYANGTQIYLNPVIFTKKANAFDRQPLPYVDQNETYFFRGIGMLVIGTIVWNLFRRKRRQGSGTGRLAWR